MGMWKVYFKDGKVQRSIKIMAPTKEEALQKTKSKRKGFGYFAIPVRDDEHLAAFTPSFRKA